MMNQKLNYQELYERALRELTDSRQVLIDAGFDTIMRELKAFESRRAITAQPLSFHISQLVEWNQNVQTARDAFRDELKSLGYTSEQLRQIYHAQTLKNIDAASNAVDAALESVIENSIKTEKTNYEN